MPLAFSTFRSGTSHANFMPAKPCILLSAELPIVLEGLHRIAEQEGFQVIGTVRGGYALVEAAETLAPHLVVLEFAMPGLNGMDAARQIRKTNPRVPLLFLGLPADEPAICNAMRDGANGYVFKGATVTELGAAMWGMLAGRIYSSPPLAVRHRSRVQTPSESARGARPLTTRQREVLQLVSEGKTAKEVAFTLNISTKTAEFHKAKIMGVLQLRTTAELTRYAIQHKITGCDGPDWRRHEVRARRANPTAF